MFSIVFFDNSNQTLHLSRDFLGKKPLFYQCGKNFIRWSSSQTSFSQKHNITSNNALISYLSLGYLLDPASGFNDVYSVMPGELVTFDMQTYKLRKDLISKYNFDLQGDTIGSSATFRQVFHSSVKNRVENHNKIAISLSGGLDSSLVAIEASNLGKKVCAFSATWPDSDKARYNFDSAIAQSTAKYLGVDFKEVSMPVSSQISTKIEIFLEAMGEPNSNPSGISLMNLYEDITNFDFRLVLTGDGADEIFSGYERYNKISSFINLFQLENSSNKYFFEDSQNFLQSKISKFLLTQASSNSDISWTGWHWIFSPMEIVNYFPSIKISEITQILFQSLSNIIKVPKKTNPIEAMMLRDRQIWLVMESNRKLDRVSMYNSVEARSPFQDFNMIDYASKFMQSRKFKELNKQLFYREYPELFELNLPKKKAGLISPVGHWLRNNSSLVNESLNYLYFSQKLVSKKIFYLKDAPSRGSYRELLQLWNLVVLAKWLKRVM